MRQPLCVCSGSQLRVLLQWSEPWQGLGCLTPCALEAEPAVWRARTGAEPQTGLRIDGSAGRPGFFPEPAFFFLRITGVRELRLPLRALSALLSDPRSPASRRLHQARLIHCRWIRACAQRDLYAKGPHAKRNRVLDVTNRGHLPLVGESPSAKTVVFGRYTLDLTISEVRPFLEDPRTIDPCTSRSEVSSEACSDNGCNRGLSEREEGALPPAGILPRQPVLTHLRLCSCPLRRAHSCVPDTASGERV